MEPEMSREQSVAIAKLLITLRRVAIGHDPRDVLVAVSILMEETAHRLKREIAGISEGEHEEIVRGMCATIAANVCGKAN
jgi:hypothetical protein